MQREDENSLSSDHLQPGDIIFTLDQTGRAGHAAIWAPEEGSLRPLAHAVNGGNKSEVTKTFLPPPGKGNSYVVVRSKDPELAAMVAQQANRWCRYATPYDPQRLEIGERRENTLSNHKKDPQATLDQYQREEFNAGGKYRMIKYASRRMGPLTMPESCGGSGRGFRCSMFALTCLQTAALAKEGLVKPLCGGSDVPWVSDKYTSPELIKGSKPKSEKKSFNSGSKFKKGTFLHSIKGHIKAISHWKQDLPAYQHFTESIKGRDTEFLDYKHYKDHKRVVADHQQFAPSITAWDYEKNGSIEHFPFEEVLGTGLMLEPKTTSPAMLLYAMSQDKTMWHDAVPMTLSEKHAQKPTPEKIEEYKQENVQASKQAEKMQSNMSAYLSGHLNQLPTFEKDFQEEKDLQQHFRPH